MIPDIFYILEPCIRQGLFYAQPRLAIAGLIA